MPIEIRKSDVLASAAQSLSRWGETFQQIASNEYEKERVRQVNYELVTLEETLQKIDDEMPKETLELYPMVEAGKNPLSPAAIPPVKKSFGQLEKNELLGEYHKRIKILADHFNSTITNKKAREEMMQHLAMGSMQEQARLLTSWNKARKINSLVVLDDLSKSVTGTAEEKSHKIKTRIDEMVLAGWLNEKEAGDYFETRQKEYQYVEGYNGALNAMKTMEGKGIWNIPQPKGLLEPGNIDITNRPRVKNADGSISTIRSISIEIDGKEILIPTVNDAGRIMTDEEAIIQYKKTGKHLGIFDSAEHATTYAKNLHEAQAEGLLSGSEVAYEWLERNTPFWNNQPEMRAEVLKKLNIYLDEQAKAQDTIFSDRFANAETVDKLDQLEADLKVNQLMRGTQKHTWAEWIREKKTRIEKAGPSGIDVVSSLYSRMYEAFDKNKNPGLEVTIREINDTVKDKEDHQALLAKRNELQKSYESGLGSTQEDVLLAGYDVIFHPNMSIAAKQKWVDDHAKAGGGLSAEDAKKLRGWIDPYNENKDRKDAMDAITTAYHLSMANVNIGPPGKKELALELYNARNSMEALFLKPGVTKPEIDKAVESFLTNRASEDLKTLIIQNAGANIGSFATGEIRGAYRQATMQEYLREQGQLTGKVAAQFPRDFREKAEQLEKDALRKANIKADYTSRLSSGDLVYSTKPIAKGATGKLLMSDTGNQGTLYQVRYQIKNGTYVPTVYRQNPKTGAFDEIAWEWK